GNGDEYRHGFDAFDHLAARARDGKRLASQRLHRCCTERNGHIGSQERKLLLQPPIAGANFAGVRLCMDASLAARSEFEVLHRIGDISLAPVDTDFLEDRVEELACRADEGLTG